MFNLQRSTNQAQALAKTLKARPLTYRPTGAVVADAELTIAQMNDDLLGACVLAGIGNEFLRCAKQGLGDAAVEPETTSERLHDNPRRTVIFPQ
jgi:hypothetical protein